MAQWKTRESPATSAILLDLPNQYILFPSRYRSASFIVLYINNRRSKLSEIGDPQPCQPRGLFLHEFGVLHSFTPLRLCAIKPETASWRYKSGVVSLSSMSDKQCRPWAQAHTRDMDLMDRPRDDSKTQTSSHTTNARERGDRLHLQRTSQTHHRHRHRVTRRDLAFPTSLPTVKDPQRDVHHHLRRVDRKDTSRTYVER